MFSDQAISSAAEDELGIVPFVRRLAHPLLNAPPTTSLVVGLYGPWGLGKSSALNLLAAHLRGGVDGRRVLIARFNPWYYESVEALLLSFFGTLAAATGNSPFLDQPDRDRLKRALVGIGRFAAPVLKLAPIPGGGIAGDIVAGAANSLEALLEGGEADLEQGKSEAANVLEALGRQDPPVRVVVLIDDVDRADADEVRAVLKLVRLIADLPNVSYVLAMDVDRVREVLNGSHNSSNDYGTAYLEKIIQVPVFLPPIADERLRALTLNAIREVLQEAGLPTHAPLGDDSELTQYEVERLVPRRVRTLRDRGRWVNTLRFALQTGEDPLEIHAPDMVLLCFLQTFYPEVYDRVRRNIRALTRAFDLTEVMIENSGRNSPDQLHRERTALLDRVIGRPQSLAMIDSSPEPHEGIRRSLAGTPPDDHDITEAVIRHLFPYADKAGGPSETDARQLRIQNRIASSERYDRYFRLSPPPEEVSDQEVDALVEEVERIVEADTAAPTGDARNEACRAIAALLVAIVVENQRFADSLIGKLVDRLAELAVPVAEALTHGVLCAATDLGLTSDEMSDPDEPSRNHRAGEFAATVVGLLLGHRPERSHATPSVQAALRTALRHIELTPDDREAAMAAARYVTRLPESPERRAVISRGLERARAHAVAALDDLARGADQRVSSFIWRWRDLLAAAGEPFDDISGYLVRGLDSAPGALPAVLALGAGWSNGRPSLTGVQSTAEIKRSLSTLLDLDDLAERAKAFVSESASGATDPFGLARQFLDHVMAPPPADDGEPAL